MQKITKDALIEVAKKLLDNGTVSKVLGWKKGEFSYDVTPFIKPGKKQTMEVLVCKESANASVNSAERRADWWLFGGIYRPVYIEVLPKEHISHVSIDARANGEIYANIEATSDKPVSLFIDPATSIISSGN